MRHVWRDAISRSPRPATGRVSAVSEPTARRTAAAPAASRPVGTPNARPAAADPGNPTADRLTRTRPHLTSGWVIAHPLHTTSLIRRDRAPRATPNIHICGRQRWRSHIPLAARIGGYARLDT